MITSIRFRSLLAVLGAALITVGTASAGDPALVDQYQEPLPIGGGNIHTGGGGGGGSPGGGGVAPGGETQLPSATIADLYGSVSEPVATALEAVATSPELGAQPITKRPQDASEMSLSSAGPFEELAEIAVGNESSRALIVVLALALATLAGALLTVLIRRARAQPPQ